MAFKKIDIYNINSEKRIGNLQKLTNKKDYETILNHLENLEIKKNISEARKRKLVDIFTFFFKRYKKTLAATTKQDLEKFKKEFANCFPVHFCNFRLFKRSKINFSNSVH